MKNNRILTKTCVIDIETTWYITYIDSSHFYPSNTLASKGMPWHIGQFRDKSYYNDLYNWLKAMAFLIDYNKVRK